jgi:hypothetical protein
MPFSTLARIAAVISDMASPCAGRSVYDAISKSQTLTQATQLSEARFAMMSEKPINKRISKATRRVRHGMRRRKAAELAKLAGKVPIRLTQKALRALRGDR